MKVLSAYALCPNVKNADGDLIVDDLGVREALFISTRIRRVGRHARMALTATAGCMANSPGDVDLCTLGVVLGSGLGNTGETTPLVEQTVALAMGLTTGPASPVQFANSVSNSATFQAARVIGAMGVNAVVSQDDRSFEGALQMAMLAVETGDATACLVGGADELVQPRTGPLARQGLTPQTVLGEGAAFLLLGDGPNAIGEIVTADFLRKDEGFEHTARLLDSAGDDGETLTFLAGPGVDDGVLGHITRTVGKRYAIVVERPLAQFGRFPTMAACAVADLFAKHHAGLFLYLSCDLQGIGLIIGRVSANFGQDTDAE